MAENKSRSTYAYNYITQNKNPAQAGSLWKTIFTKYYAQTVALAPNAADSVFA